MRVMRSEKCAAGLAATASSAARRSASSAVSSTPIGAVVRCPARPAHRATGRRRRTRVRVRSISACAVRGDQTFGRARGPRRTRGSARRRPGQGVAQRAVGAHGAESVRGALRRPAFVPRVVGEAGSGRAGPGPVSRGRGIPARRRGCRRAGGGCGASTAGASGPRAGRRATGWPARRRGGGAARGSRAPVSGAPRRGHVGPGPRTTPRRASPHASATRNGASGARVAAVTGSAASRIARARRIHAAECVRQAVRPASRRRGGRSGCGAAAVCDPHDAPSSMVVRCCSQNMAQSAPWYQMTRESTMKTTEHNNIYCVYTSTRDDVRMHHRQRRSPRTRCHAERIARRSSGMGSLDTPCRRWGERPTSGRIMMPWMHHCKSTPQPHPMRRVTATERESPNNKRQQKQHGR
jgi:hypothetical protein